MQWIDWAIIGIISVSMLTSLLRGFMKEMLSMIAWVAAFFVAMNFYHPLAELFTFTDDVYVKTVIAVFVLFIATLMSIGMINYLITTVLKKTGLSGTDRMLGMSFGAARGLIIVVSVAAGLQLMFHYGFMSGVQNEPWYTSSKMLPEINQIAVKGLKYFSLLK